MLRNHFRAAALGAFLVGFSAMPGQAAPSAVKLTAAQERSMGLRLTAAQGATETPLASLPASIAPPLNGRVVASVPFAGTVVRVDALEGQIVKAGQILAVLFSQDALRVSTELARAQAEVRMADAAAARARTLASEGVVAGARAEEAEARAAQARALAAESRRLLSSAGGATGRPGEYALRAPIAGRVAQMNLQPGGGLGAMAPAVVIDRNDKLWVEARLPAALIGKVSAGDAVEVEGTRGRVLAAGTSIDPRTRSAVLRAELAAPAGLVPGQATSVTVFAKAPVGAVATPRNALTRIGGRDAVFVQTATGYQPVFVKVIGLSDAGAVVSGLAPGAQVVSSGVSQLKSAADR